MSDLTGIYDALAAETVTVGDKAVAAWKLDEVKNSVETADLPVRLQLPPGADGLGAGGSGLVEFEDISFGMMQVAWRLTELMLWRPVGQGAGVRTVWRELAEYSAAYAEMLRATKFPTSVSKVIGFDPLAGIFEWPRGSNRVFYGVQCTVLVAETLC